jgi:release factor glutamine methyltransferase
VSERILDLTRKAADVFRERGFENARLEAELLLAGVLGLKRLDLYLQHDRPLDATELERYREVVRRRLKREPLQYVLGTAAFRQLELRVDRRALIPRPETEVLVGAVLEWAAARAAAGAPVRTVADIGTGTGAIALSLAAEGEFERVVATDISADALQLARENAAACGLEGRVEFRCGSLLDPLAADRFDAIVSNPPYVGEAERGTLAAEVVAWEPALALFSGEDGLDALRLLIDGAAVYLKGGGLLALEVGAAQGEEVLELARRTGAYTGERIGHDLAGRPRFLLAERAVNGST